MNSNFEQALGIINCTAETWRQLARNVPPELFSLKPTPAEWSALECLAHLIDTEVLFASRLNAFLNGENLPAFNPDKEGTQLGSESSQVELAEKFAALRAANLPALRALTVSDVSRSAVHSELGAVTLLQMVNEWAAHDLNHTMQAQRALMQPFIGGSGPWMVYFKHHRFD